MDILLLGAFDAEEYRVWTAHLSHHIAAGDRLPRADAPHDPASVEIALVANPTPGQLVRYENLRFIQSLWAGVDRLLTDVTLPDVPIARLIDPDMTTAMVECVVAHVTALHRQTPAYARQQTRSEWLQLVQPLARERCVGVLGLGELGAAAAQALVRLGFRVSGWSRGSRVMAGVRCLSGSDGLMRLAQDSDILVNLLPLTPETTGILDAKLFAAMPRGASLVNVARGAHLNEDDLLEALDGGQLGHAVLDVFRGEPLPQTHPFWRHPHISVFPHVAAATPPASAARIAVANIQAFRTGGTPVGLVDRARGY